MLACYSFIGSSCNCSCAHIHPCPPSSFQVYLNERDKPEVGSGLNRPAEITLLRVFKLHKETDRPVTDEKAIEGFVRKLKKVRVCVWGVCVWGKKGAFKGGLVIMMQAMHLFTLGCFRVAGLLIMMQAIHLFTLCWFIAAPTVFVVCPPINHALPTSSTLLPLLAGHSGAGCPIYQLRCSNGRMEV